MGLNLFMVQPLFYGKVFAPYRLILLPFSIRNLIAFLPQTSVHTPTPPGTSPPSEGLGRPHPPFPLFLSTTIQSGNFITLCRSSLRNIPFNKSYTTTSAVFITSKPRLPTLPCQAHPLLRRGLGRPPFIFQIFPSTPLLALKYWKYERVIFWQNPPFLFLMPAASSSVD